MRVFDSKFDLMIHIKGGLGLVEVEGRRANRFDEFVFEK